MKIFRKIFSNPSFGDISIPFLSQGCFLDAGESTGEARRRGTLLPDADDPVGHLRPRNGVVRHVLHSAAQLGDGAAGLLQLRVALHGLHGQKHDAHLHQRQRQLAQYIQLGHRP